MAETQTHEQTLVARAQQQDRDAIAEIYRRFADRLYRQVIYPHIPDAAMAEDILKETFVTMMEQIHRYRWEPERGIFPWLATIARNRALDRHRQHARHDRLNGVYRHHLDLLSHEPTPSELLEDQQELQLAQQRVRACMEHLNDRYRNVLELRMFQELSREECAARLDIQIGTFDVVYFRALKAFRKVWESLFATP